MGSGAHSSIPSRPLPGSITARLTGAAARPRERPAVAARRLAGGAITGTRREQPGQREQRPGRLGRDRGDGGHGRHRGPVPDRGHRCRASSARIELAAPGRVRRRAPRGGPRCRRVVRGLRGLVPEGAGASATRRLLDRDVPPDALFCFSDPLALGAIRALRQRGVRIPDDVAVVGFDDIEDGRFSTPSLTTVSPDRRFIARTALERVEAKLAKTADDSNKPTIAPHRLEIRESSAAPTLPI